MNTDLSASRLLALFAIGYGINAQYVAPTLDNCRSSPYPRGGPALAVAAMQSPTPTRCGTARLAEDDARVLGAGTAAFG